MLEIRVIRVIRAIRGNFLEALRRHLLTSPPTMNPRLICIYGPLEGQTFVIGNEGLWFGRGANNQLVLDDLTVSGAHGYMKYEKGSMWVHDLGSKNGIPVEGVSKLDQRVPHGSRVQIGSCIFIYLEYDADPEDLPTIVRDEQDLRRKVATLKLDTSAGTDRAIYLEDVVIVLIEAIEELATAKDPMQVQEWAIAKAFRLVPARRCAIWLNGAKGSPDDFVSRIFRERGVEGMQPFTLSGRVLDEVYRTGVPAVSQEAPAGLCAPLMDKDTGGIFGIFYMQGTEPGEKFTVEHSRYVRAMAAATATALKNNRRLESQKAENRDLRRQLGAGYEILGETQIMKDHDREVTLVAKSPRPVLIFGQTGSGKELVARQIHWRSPRCNGPFIAVNCAAITKELADSYIFGHSKGAFTGAMADREGKLREAVGGTIFFDELGLLSLEVQGKLLRFLDDYIAEPVGGREKDIRKLDVRVIAATNKDLKAAIAKGEFLEDLYERLNALQILVPPLRDRRDDIPLLIDHFIESFGPDKGVSDIAPDAVQLLINYPWPRNVRQLRNVISGIIDKKDPDLPNLAVITRAEVQKALEPLPVAEASQSFPLVLTPQVLARTLQKNDWNMAETERELGLPKNYGYQKARKWGIRNPNSGASGAAV